jgi:hypothetical protein
LFPVVNLEGFILLKNGNLLIFEYLEFKLARWIWENPLVIRGRYR